MIVESHANFTPKFMAGRTSDRLLTAEIMPSHARNKLLDRQVKSEKKPGLYGDGGGLYLRIRPSGRSWIFIGTLKPKGQLKIKNTGKGHRIELGLGSALDVGLAKARHRAAEIRDMLLEGIDPRVERLKSKEEAKPADDKGVGTGNMWLELGELSSYPDGYEHSWLAAALKAGPTQLCIAVKFRRGLQDFAEAILQDEKAIAGLKKAGFKRDDDQTVSGWFSQPGVPSGADDEEARQPPASVADVPRAVLLALPGTVGL